MRKTGKNKAVAMLIVVAMVIGMLPMGVLPAFAATTASPTSPTSKVITGTSDTTVTAQPADNITVREDSVDKTEWSTGDRTVVVSLTGNVKFSSKPTVTFNGAAIAASSVSFPAARTSISFSVTGDDTKRDEIVISGIKLDLGVYAIGNLGASITGVPNAPLTAYIAKVQKGVIFSEPTTIPTVKIDTTNQALNAFKLTESEHKIVKVNDYITITAPTGVTFYQPPVATVTTSTLKFYNDVATLNEARTEAKWQASDESSGTAAVISVASSINVAASFAADTDIKFEGKTSSADYTVAPASVKVAKSSAADALKFEAAAAPTISNIANQAAANVTITETKAAALATGDNTLTIELVSGTFASSPIATPTGTGLTLKNAAGDAVTTGVAGKLSTDFKKATWSVADQSSVAGKLSFTGLVVNANGLPDGAVKVKIYGGVVGIPLAANAKQLTIANVSTSQTITLSASSSPALKVNAANQAAGDIIITETKAGAITSPIVLSIFGNTADKEVLFGEKPTVSVTVGDLETTATIWPVGTDEAKVQIDLKAASTAKSTIKISGIKYDINAKAKAGAIQVVVSSGGTRVGAVTNAYIGDKPVVFKDVPTTHWAISYIENLLAKGIIAGYTDGTFRPSNTITRAEIAKMVAVAKGLSPATGSSFSDTSGHWAAGYIEAIKAAGYINGYPNGTFRPNNNITRAEIAKIVVLAAGFTINTSGAGFSDIAGHWASDYILTAANKGVVGGYTDGTFRPSNSATRAEASKMVSIWVDM